MDSQLVFKPDLASFAAPYCIPSAPCWPGPSLWADLNATTTGKLIKPLGPCSGAPTEVGDAFWRIEQPQSLMFLNFQDGENCDHLDFPSRDNVTAASVEAGVSSALDRTPAYVLEAHNAEDVVAAVRFSKEHHLRLRVKNTGHDYLGRSGDHGSFTLWTHNLKDSTYEEEFVPEGAPEGTVPEKALRVGAGNVVKDLYEAADKAEVVVTAGVSQTVGGAGGFALGGGHGPFGPSFGLAADNVLEFLVVTSNATLVRASAYSNPTLFTALRGGGPAFGVVVETVFRAHDAPEGFVGIFGHFAVKKDAVKEEGDQAWKGLLKLWTDLQPVLSEKAPFAGYTYVQRPAASPFAYVLPSNELALAQELFEPIFEFAASNPSLEIAHNFVQTETWYEMWHGPFTSALQSLDAVGINLLIGSRLIPKDVVEHEEKSQDLATFLAESHSPSIIHLVAGRAMQNEPALPSSVNPAWRKALLHIVVLVSWPVSAPTAIICALSSFLTSHTLSLGRIASSLGAPEAGYSSESDFNEVEWQKVWYGEENYERLIEAKKEWDPTGVFGGRKTVGSEVLGW